MYENFVMIRGLSGYAVLWWVDAAHPLPQRQPGFEIARGWTLNVARDGSFDFRIALFEKRIGQDSWWGRAFPPPACQGALGRAGTVHDTDRGPNIGLLTLPEAAMLEAMAARMAVLGGIP